MPHSLYPMPHLLYRVTRSLYPIARLLYRVGRTLYQADGPLYSVGHFLYPRAHSLYRMAVLSKAAAFSGRCHEHEPANIVYAARNPFADVERRAAATFPPAESRLLPLSACE